MMPSQKSVSKSIRLTPELYEYINQYRGDGFNEKFNNIITDARDSAADRETRCRWLDEDIAHKRQIMQQAKEQVSELLRLLRPEC